MLWRVEVIEMSSFGNHWDKEKNFVAHHWREAELRANSYKPMFGKKDEPNIASRVSSSDGGDLSGAFYFLLLPEYILVGYFFYRFINKVEFGGFYLHLFAGTAATATVLALLLLLHNYLLSTIVIAAASAAGWCVGLYCFVVAYVNHTGFSDYFRSFLNRPDNLQVLLNAYTNNFSWIFLIIPLFAFWLHIMVHDPENQSTNKFYPLQSLFHLSLFIFILAIPFTAYFSS